MLNLSPPTLSFFVLVLYYDLTAIYMELREVSIDWKTGEEEFFKQVDKVLTPSKNIILDLLDALFLLGMVQGVLIVMLEALWRTE